MPQPREKPAANQRFRMVDADTDWHIFCRWSQVVDGVKPVEHCKFSETDPVTSRNLVSSIATSHPLTPASPLTCLENLILVTLKQ